MPITEGAWDGTTVACLNLLKDDNADREARELRAEEELKRAEAMVAEQPTKVGEAP